MTTSDETGAASLNMAILFPPLAVSGMVLMAAVTPPATIDKYHITPAEHAACDGDAVRLCLSAYPDEDRLLACMRTNFEALTSVCRATVRAGLQRRHMPM